MLKRAFFLILCIASVISCVSCNEEPDFSHAEMTIPLPSSFERVDKENYDAAFTDGEVVITVLRLSFSAAFNDGIPETMNSKEFAEFWINRSGRDYEIKLHGGVDYAEYTEEAGGVEYYYVSAFYRTQHAYFVVVFATHGSLAEARGDDILSYMSSVYFVNPEK